MTQRKSRILLAAALLCVFCLPAHAQTLYRLTRILVDSPTGHLVEAHDLNDEGQVVGVVSRSGIPHAFAWRDGVSTDLEPLIDPSSTRTNALGTNKRADIVGDYLDSQTGTFAGFLLRRGEVMQRIDGWPGATHTTISDINDRRQAVGESYDAEGLSYAFIWKRGELVQLQPLAGDTFANPLQINNRGVVAGISSGDSGTRAVIWKNGHVRKLGIRISGVSAINDLAQVVGHANARDGSIRVYLWDRGQVTYLPLLAGDPLFGGASDINNLGVIVGRTFYAEHTTATLWEGGVAVDLNERIAAYDPSQPFVTLEGAVLINERNQIVAFGNDSRTTTQFNLYLLTPAP